MTLREEIYNIITKYNIELGYGVDATNDIIKEFEKRIDEKMNPYINMDNKLPYEYGCLETLEKVKEMLKT